MKRLTIVTLAALLLFASPWVIADDQNARHVNDDPHLRNAEEYRWRASTLEGKQRELGYRQQWIVSELIDVYYRLAENKAALADAHDAEDQGREGLLETEYYNLKQEERELWAELERVSK